ncbi:MAG: DUF2007 domain-containing protein [Lachnospiraceae bacterium]|nr:DUF2007 domain-containing protein [Lachnospiraceae bacterium]
MFPDNYQSVYTGFDPVKFNAVRDLLDAHNIKYRYTADDHQGRLLLPGRGTVRGAFGSLGADLSASCQYEIKVSSKDLTKARSILHDNGYC